MSFKTSLQRDLDRFYKTISASDFNIREVTKGALTQARAKLDPWAFKRLNEVSSNAFYRDAEYYTWNELRLLSVDGSRIQLPNHSSNKDVFGEFHLGCKAEAPRSIAIVSLLYDVLNQITVDSEIDSWHVGERDLLLRHLERVGKGDMLLLDKGYPCFWLFFLLTAKEIEFCMRLNDNWWLEARDFRNSDEKERLVKFKLPKKDRNKLQEYPQVWDKEITCRLIKVDLENGEKEVLCTSLTDGEKYDKEDFGQLYHYRWNHEEAYKLLKNRVELESFSGKTAKAVKQDFYAKVFLMTMCAVFAHPIEEKVRTEYKTDQERKHSQKINRTNAMATTMDMLIPMFIKRKFQEALNAFDLIVYQTREIIRPGRSLVRKKIPKKPYHMNYKRI